MTFSIVARCALTGQFGAAVCSSSPAVAARCIRARAGVGAVASQNITDPALGNQALDLMASGMSAEKALNHLCATTENISFRQLMAVDRAGLTAIFTGDKCLGIVGQAEGPQVACAGNLLAGEAIPAAMVKAFADSTGPLVDRMLLAMRAAMALGGEAGPVHSAGLLLVDAQSWPIADLRVDWSEADPIEELSQLWSLYSPQMGSYVQRAQSPSIAPSYGVPGDL